MYALLGGDCRRTHDSRGHTGTTADQPTFAVHFQPGRVALGVLVLQAEEPRLAQPDGPAHQVEQGAPSGTPLPTRAVVSSQHDMSH